MAKFSEIAIEKSMRLIAHALAAGRVTTIASGLEHIPAAGPALIVARHYHHLLDGLSFFAALPRPFHIVVALDWAKNRRTKFFFETLTGTARWPVFLRGDALTRAENTLFSRDDVLRYQRRALRTAVELLGEGRIVVVFPEGYPNIDPTYTPKTDLEEFLPFKPGFAKIARAAEKRAGRSIPIVPAGLRYTTGQPQIAHLKLGQATYRENFNDTRALMVHLEKSVQQLSAADDLSD